MNMTEGIFLLIIGIIAGGYGTIIGAGGGFIFVPALLIFLNMDPVIAAGSGLVIVLINSLTGVIGYSKEKRIHYQIALTIGISAIPGALIGVWLLQLYSSKYFHVIFAMILVTLGIFLLSKNTPFKRNLFSRNTYSVKTPNKQIKLNRKWLLPLGLMIGILSSYLGIGGGWLLVPILIYLFKIPTHQATATSILSLCIYSTIGVSLQIYYNNIDWITVIFGGVGVIIGANLGVLISRRLSGKIIMQMLSFLLIVIGVRMFFQ